MKLPSLKIFKDSEPDYIPKPRYRKVEKRWRYDRKQFQRWNTTATTNNDAPPPPILVVGLPKAGTSSLFEFFSCHGLYSQHWYCCGPQKGANLPGSGGPRFGPSYMSNCLLENLQEQTRQQKQADLEAFDSKWNHSILDGCGDYDVYTELNGPYIPPSNEEEAGDEIDPFRSAKGIFLPQHYHLEELHAAAPTATWILNVRDVEDWVRSVWNVPARTLVERLQYEVLARHAEENKLDGKYQKYDLLKDELMKSKTKTAARGKLGWSRLRGDKKKLKNKRSIPIWKQEEAFLKDFWYDHIQRIQDFIKDHEHPLIVVNISDANAGLQLGMDLGWFGEASKTINITRVVKPKRASPPRAEACWRHYNAGDYQHDRN